jgi:glycerophosphoryl diester phosphodiesterase
MTDIYAHRGWHHRHRENTVDAFRAAVALGVDGIELDVRRTADGKLVVHHDPHLEDGRNIVDLDAADLPDWLPTLGAALAACDGVLTVNLEIKNNVGDPDYDTDQLVARAMCDAIAVRGLRDRVVVSSFDLATIDFVHAADPAIRTAWLVFDANEAIRTAVERGHTGLNPFFGLVDQALVERARAAGLTVVPWTVDDPERIAELARWGAHGVITNVPELALDQLGLRDGDNEN